MPTPLTTDQRIANMLFSSVYPLYLAKVEKKGRNRAELDQVIEWLTGFSDQQIKKFVEEKVSFATFFSQATLNPNAHLITGLICGYRVEEITNPLSQKVRYLDKLVDELAKGKKMEKILRAWKKHREFEWGGNYPHTQTHAGLFRIGSDEIIVDQQSLQWVRSINIFGNL